MAGSRTRSLRPLGRFLALFVGLLLLLNGTFEALASVYRPVVLQPIAYAGFVALAALGVPVEYGGPAGVPGFCEYRLPAATLQVRFGCTGIFALFILLAAVAAFPGRLRAKAVGAALAVPAFYVYSIGRLVAISLVGYHFPPVLDLAHSYLMECLNVAFVLAACVVWIRYVDTAAGARPVPR